MNAHTHWGAVAYPEDLTSVWKTTGLSSVTFRMAAETVSKKQKAFNTTISWQAQENSLFKAKNVTHQKNEFLTYEIKRFQPKLNWPMPAKKD